MLKEPDVQTNHTFNTTTTVAPNDKHNLEWQANVFPPNHQNPTPAPSYNLVVIGGGSAGLVAAAGVAGLGGKVAVIERDSLGGDCLNTGCVPSKAVIRASRVAGELRKAPEMGFQIDGPVNIDFGVAMERMRRVRADISHHDSTARFAELGIDVFLGEGSFVSENQIGVGDAVLNFKKALVATGGRAMALPIPGLADTGYLTNESVFSLTERPERLAIIGAGPIGAELAQAFQRLGSQVTVFDMLPQVLGREDRDAAGLVERVMREEGIALYLEAGLKQVFADNTGKVIEFEYDGNTQSLAFDEILAAAGRVPNVEGLNLEAAGIEYHKKGITIDDHLQTTNPNVYAAGDVSMKFQFTHTADAAARIVVQNAFFFGRKKLSALTVPWVTYTDPEVAHVGLYPHQSEEAGFEIDTFHVPMAENHRAVADGVEAGFVKIHVKKGSDKIVGATIVAPHAGEMISQVTTAMVAKMGLKGLTNVIFPYPTQSEAIRRAADNYNRTRLTPSVKKILSTWLAWTR